VNARLESYPSSYITLFVKFGGLTLDEAIFYFLGQRIPAKVSDA